jgi:hypothetical protein
MLLVIAGWETPMARAAARRLPRSTVATKSRIWFSRMHNPWLSH